jgi:hypothetical protein
MNRQVRLFIEGRELDLFNDEQIQVSSSVQNVYDISKSHTDISQSFTVPGTNKNNQIFEHFYENSVDGSLDYGLRRDGYIEIDLATFRKGRISLEKATLTNGKIENYTITFYGKLVSLKDIFGDDKLSDLDYSTISHLFDWTEVYGRVTGTITDDVAYPLISSNRLWEYVSVPADFNFPNWLTSTVTNNNININSGAINVLTELFPAVRVSTIFNLIMAKYGLNFYSIFSGTEQFNAAFLWFKNRDTVKAHTLANYVDFDALTSNTIVDIDTSQYVNLSLNSVNVVYQPSFATYHRIFLDVTSVSSSTVNYWIDVYVNGVLFSTYDGVNGSLNGVTGYATIYENSNVAGLNDTVLMKVRADAGLSIDFNMMYRIYDGAIINQSIYSCVVQNLVQFIDLSICAPDMKIIDFFSGVLKQFNMIVENIGENDYKIEPLLDWYTQGNIYDITRYTDATTIEVAKVPLYKQISFKYQPSESALNKQYLQQAEKEYGNMSYQYPYDGGNYDIQLPFENLMFNQYDHAGGPSGLQVGYSVNSALAPYIPKPMILYKYGLVTGLPHNVHYKDGTGNTGSSDKYIMFGQDVTNSTTGIDYSLNFGPETSTYHRYAIQQGLFATYYYQYLANLYAIKNRITTYKTILPISLLTGLRLNDRVIIRDKRYIINDMNCNLTTGEVTLRLLNDFMPVSASDIIPPLPEDREI